MIDRRVRRVFLEMVREEWRLHSQLFRGSHFALFPVLIGLLTAGTVQLLVTTGTPLGSVFAGLHALAFVFGLHTGSIGFVGRDALQNLLGEVTLLVFAGRTLPLSRTRLLVVFVIKDVVYYAVLFMVPIALGTGLIVRGVDGSGFVLLLWSTLSVSFVLGLGTTIAGIGVAKRGIPGIVFLVVVAGAVGGALSSGIDIVAYTPYGVFLAQTVPRIGGTIGFVVLVFVLGVLTFDPTVRRPARTTGPSFRRWNRRVGNPTATKTLLDVHRSAGGFGKVFFSAAILFGVTAGLVSLAGRITGVAPSAGISFGTILGLTGFTTYNWLTQSDDIESYCVHPLAVRDIFEAKFRSFLVLGPVVGLGFYALALIWRGGPVGEALIGAVLLLGVTCYLFGMTLYLTGLSPNEFLFDARLFTMFGIAMAVPLVPILVVGFALAPAPSGLLVGLGISSIGLGGIGVGLYRASIPKWSDRLRQS